MPIPDAHRQRGALRAGCSTETYPNRVTYTDHHADAGKDLSDILRHADIVLVSDNSTSMISEAVACHLPTVSFVPNRGKPSRSDVDYRALMRQRGWYSTLSVNQLDDDALLQAAAWCTPLDYDPLDKLADPIVEQCLPDLFETPVKV